MKVKTTYPEHPINDFNQWAIYIHSLLNQIRR
jgi:hypothetical protein